MGLTVHFKMAAPEDCTRVQVRRLVMGMRRVASRFCAAGGVEKVYPVTTDAEVLNRYCCEWLSIPVPGEEHTYRGLEILPVEGFLFHVSVGADCEPLALGLCRYPKKIAYEDKMVSSKQSGGWQFSGFTKTQYASLHGWEHFRRCHCAVVGILDELRQLGLKVRIRDEGGYWPRRSLTALRREVNLMNGLVAGMAGALKDMGEVGKVESPIFQHKDFERLEAEGEAKHGKRLQQAKRVISRIGK